MHTSYSRLSGFTVLAIAALAACGGGDDGGPKTVTLEFVAAAGSDLLPNPCAATLTQVGTTQATAKVKDFRFYIAQVTLIKADGSKEPLDIGANNDWNHTAGADRITLIDLEDGTGSCDGGTTATNSKVTGTVPAAEYVGVEMTMGVPFALNHTDTTSAPKPLDIPAMAWSWQSGRKFAKIEITDPDGATGTWTAKTFNFHLGSTGCTGNPASGQTVSCAAPNRMAFHFHDFDATRQKIAVDVKALMAGNNVAVNGGGPTGCMSGTTDPECPAVFDVLKLDLATGLPIDDGHGQTLFKAIAK